MAANSADKSERAALIRGLGVWSATAIVIGDTIGTGIFLVSSDMARAVGSATFVLAAWILVGLIVLLGAFCYAELGAAFPKAGGPYVYLSRGLSPLWGFLFGWMSSFLEKPVGMATLAAGFVRFLGFFFPVLATPWFTSHLGHYEFTLSSVQPLAALLVVVVTAINYFSVRMSGAMACTGALVRAWMYRSLVSYQKIAAIAVGFWEFPSAKSPKEFWRRWPARSRK